MLRFGGYLLRFHLVSDLSRSNKHSRTFACCSWFYRNYCTVPNIIKKCMPWDHWDIGKKVYLSFHFFSECTQAGILKLSSSRTLPFWWDDVSDINTLEALAVQAYNQVIQSYKNGLVYSSVATCMN